MKLAVAALAAIAATASAQCTVNPEFAGAISGTSTTTDYSFIGDAEYPRNDGYPGDGRFTGVRPGSGDQTFLLAHSSAVDGNNPGASMDPADLDIQNYDTFRFSVNGDGCFNLADNGVIVGDIDIDHDDAATGANVLDDDYHDTATVIFELANGDKVAGVAEPVNAANAPFGSQVVDDASATGPGTSTGLIEGTNTVGAVSATFAFNNVPFADTDLCGTVPCNYAQTLQRNARIFKAPADSEVVAVEVIYFSATPTDMPTNTGSSESPVMGITIVDNAPSCSAVPCDQGTLFEGVLCTSPDGCDCVCEEFPQCNPNTCTNGTPVTPFQCPTAADCECGCVDFPQCMPNTDCAPGTPKTPFQCTSADACECGCDEPTNPECTTVEAECGVATAEGTSTGKCICLEFTEEDNNNGGGTTL